MRYLRSLFAYIILCVLGGVSLGQGISDSSVVSDLESEQFYELSVMTLLGDDESRRSAVDFFVSRGELDIVPTLIFLMNVGGDPVHISDALVSLTGEDIRTWRDWMVWQESRPDVTPHPSYYALKLNYFSSIDSRFADFFDFSVYPLSTMKVRFEEVTWGGVRVDGIPSLDSPEMITGLDADYLLDTDLVFGIEINGDARAYPLRIMGWHEMFNDVIGGVPVALAYCTLCGSGILFETSVSFLDEPLIFGSSGLLYRSNKLMFDRQTGSLWNQFTGESVYGELVDSGIKLKIRPVVITSWSRWFSSHPDTTVLSLETGHFRDYGSGVVYKDYFSSPDLMFPTTVRDESYLLRKDYVYGIRDFGVSRAWALEVFDDQKILHDSIGDIPLVLLGDSSTRTVRAYRSDGKRFELTDTDDELLSGGDVWKITESHLAGPDNKKLARMPGHISYWFAWDGYLGLDSSLYRP